MLRKKLWFGTEVFNLLTAEGQRSEVTAEGQRSEKFSRELTFLLPSLHISSRTAHFLLDCIFPIGPHFFLDWTFLLGLHISFWTVNFLLDWTFLLGLNISSWTALFPRDPKQMTSFRKTQYIFDRLKFFIKLTTSVEKVVQVFIKFCYKNISHIESCEYFNFKNIIDTFLRIWYVIIVN